MKMIKVKPMTMNKYRKLIIKGKKKRFTKPKFRKTKWSFN